jgi:hypothetical protein
MDRNQEVWDYGVELAQEANKAFDNAQVLENNLVRGSGDQEITAEFLNEVRIFETYCKAVGVLIGPDAFEMLKANDKFEAKEILPILTPEQIEYASKLSSAMAELFGVDEADFSVVPTKDDRTGKFEFTVALTSVIGTQEGSWDYIFNTRYQHRFMIEIDGSIFDTRLGMTLDVYTAMIEQARSSGKDLPDSPYHSRNSSEEGTIWTRTLATGELTLSTECYVCYVDRGGSVINDSIYLTSQGDYIRFRPAVKIPSKL